MVEEDGLPDEVQIAHHVNLSEFFRRTTEETEEATSSDEAYAYGAIQTVRGLVDSRLGDVLIEMNWDGQSFYRISTQTIALRHDHAAEYVPEHEIGHALMHDLVGITYLGGLCDGAHYFYRASSARCAWMEGFASFIATAAEWNHYAPGHESRSPRFNSYNVETCSGSAEECRTAGPTVEGWVTMALWDLFDGTQDSHGGFTDKSIYPLSEILDVVEQVKPTTFAEFWSAWQAAHDGDEETMFLNTLLYRGVFDADAASARTGQWKEAFGCGTCRNGSFLRSPGPARLTWNIDPLIKTSGMYDVWVKIPPQSGMDDAATYRVQTSLGPDHVIINQNARHGWINLNKYGFWLNADHTITVEIIHSPNNPSAWSTADALVVLPHQK